MQGYEEVVTSKVATHVFDYVTTPNTWHPTEMTVVSEIDHTAPADADSVKLTFTTIWKDPTNTDNSDTWNPDEYADTWNTDDDDDTGVMFRCDKNGCTLNGKCVSSTVNGEQRDCDGDGNDAGFISTVLPLTVAIIAGLFRLFGGQIH